jgi:hypothetical protein
VLLVCPDAMLRVPDAMLRVHEVVLRLAVVGHTRELWAKVGDGKKG